MLDAPLPWERQPREGTKPFEAFVIYRDQGPKRGQRPTAKAIGKSLRLIVKWSQRWRWVERARAWDEELDRQNRASQVAAVKEMRERHAREALALQEKALKRLKELKREELSASDVLRFFVEAAKLERVARGEPETIQEQRLNGEVITRTEYHERIELVLQDEIAREQIRDIVRRAIDQGRTAPARI